MAARLYAALVPAVERGALPAVERRTCTVAIGAVVRQIKISGRVGPRAPHSSSAVLGTAVTMMGETWWRLEEIDVYAISPLRDVHQTDRICPVLNISDASREAARFPPYIDQFRMTAGH